MQLVCPDCGLVDAKEHRAQRAEVGRARTPMRIAHEHRQRVQHGRERGVLLVDDLECGAGHVLRTIYPGRHTPP
jgi:hypothetical protein